MPASQPTLRVTAINITKGAQMGSLAVGLSKVLNSTVSIKIKIPAGRPTTTSQNRMRKGFLDFGALFVACVVCDMRYALRIVLKLFFLCQPAFDFNPGVAVM